MKMSQIPLLLSKRIKDDKQMLYSIDYIEESPSSWWMSERRRRNRRIAKIRRMIRSDEKLSEYITEKYSLSLNIYNSPPSYILSTYKFAYAIFINFPYVYFNLMGLDETYLSETSVEEALYAAIASKKMMR
jgi:hypothetical protein